jgi:tRNA/tmRNA/rRNA uracil-C5-methylase (TrmA/RlmC/RlmD family)
MRGVTPINPQKKIEADSNPVKESDYYEGERLTHLLDLIQRGIETSKLSNVNSLPEKIWLKVTTYYSCYGFFLFLQDSILKHHRCDVFQKQIAIGINEVTRVLERMNPNNTSDQQQNPKQLQVRHYNPNNSH